MENNRDNQPLEDGDQPLWDLMGRSRQTEVNPMFARNVIREVRQLGDAKSQGLFAWFRQPMAALASVAAVAVVILGIMMISQNPTTEVVANSPEASINDPAEEMVSFGTLGELMAVADPATLSDEALLDLLY